MKTLLSLISIFIFFGSPGWAQKPVGTPAKPAVNFVLKKQIFADDIESRLGSIQYAAVRIDIRHRLAAWLWKNGRDETGRAEAIAVRAVEELYEKESEIENPEWLKSDLFTLLEQNAKETAARLKAKYHTSPADDLDNAFDWLDKPGGDRIAAEKVLKSLQGGGELPPSVGLILSRLGQMRSPQLPVLLEAILNAAGAGNVNLDGSELWVLLEPFDDQMVSQPLRRRFFMLVLDRSRQALQTPDGGWPAPFLEAALKIFRKHAPELVPEVEGIKAAAAARTSGYGTAQREAAARIEAAEDKLAATIEEGDRTEIPSLKSSLYSRALILAVNGGKFSAAIAVVDKLRELGHTGSDEEFYGRYTDQTLEEIVKKAITAGDEDSAQKALVRILSVPRRGETWKQAALLYFDKKDRIDAEDALDKAIKTLADANIEDPQRTHALIRLVPAAQKIEKTRLSEVAVTAAKAINDLPTPGPDDKPGTDNFKKYVRAVMAVNYNVNSAMKSLLNDNKPGAIDFAERIQKREVRILADLLTGIDALEAEQKAAGRKAAQKPVKN